MCCTPECLHTVAALIFNISTHQTSLGKQQLDSCLAGSSPTGWADLVEDLSDGGVVPGGHSILAQRLLNELQHCVLRRQNTLHHQQSSLPLPFADVTLQTLLKMLHEPSPVDIQYMLRLALTTFNQILKKADWRSKNGWKTQIQSTIVIWMTEIWIPYCNWKGNFYFLGEQEAIPFSAWGFQLLTRWRTLLWGNASQSAQGW